VHFDKTLLPTRRRAWASWNYRLRPEADRPVMLTYNLNRLQGHESPEPICATLNGTEAIDPSKILHRLTYHHPVFSPAALAAQRRWDEINGQRGTYYCGAYWGYGFHEDGARSALRVAECFGARLDSCIAAST
jgi:predicted NAD/FAD-binding protein